ESFLQLQEKFFPAFLATHGPKYAVVVLVNNSQGHASYAPDALCASVMNIKPGGMQPRMCSGWYIHDGQKVTQEMVYSCHHETHPNQPKETKAILEECGLWNNGMKGSCKICPDNSTNCCARHTISLQPDFLEQKSQVQEIIEAAGHICIMLLKYHCEINFIEYFWGAVKHWL
ncbi:hypothetical protein GYMLUDRAFT_159327, partial [Collybiopsis luxurians FD-317 M1]